ncbi:MAG: DUF4982 domain-containing protein [Odoribacteraceae bacterium]|jgi:hypothetical protein|nr:DUF4982 domain-containing protein [Odoribacteraceae bacterium]
MNKKHVILLVFSLLLATARAGQDFKGNERERYNFNSRWLVHVGDVDRAREPGYDDSSWKKVTLPAAFNEDEAFRVSIHEHSDTIAWYRKHFRLPPSARGRKVFLEFEGIRFGGEIHVNGHPVGLHENGVMAFGLDITGVVNHDGENVVAARVDNSWRYRERATGSTYQWNDRNFNANYGGIPKNVYLHVTGKLYQTLPLYSNLKTTGTYVYASEIDVARRSAVVHVESEVKNEHAGEKEFSLDVTVVDMDGKVVKRMTTPRVKIKAGETRVVKTGERVEGLNFWSWGYGYLYDVSTALNVDGVAVDVVKTRAGFRETRFADGLFRLNGRVLQVKGYAERSSNEWPAVGLSVPAWLSDYSNRMMVESNANTVRWMHVTPWKQDVESCDRVGLIQVMPAGDSERDVTGRRWEHRVELMRDAIIYNRNHPSIIFYEGGNESISEEHMAELKALRDKYDPHGGRAIGSREMLDSKVAEYGGEMLYINKSARLPVFAMEYCRDEASRLFWDSHSYPYHEDGEGSKYVLAGVSDTSKPLADARAYNRNQDSFFEELITRWWDYYRARPGTGRRVSSGGLKIHFHESNTHFRGADNYRRSGVVDATRIPKDAFFAHQVMWNGWVDVEKHGAYICGHWNYEDVPGFSTGDFRKDVMVVSTGEQVELLVNGQSRGFGERSVGFLFTFRNVKYQPGIIEAVSRDADGKEVARARKETAGKAERITLKLVQAPDGFKADGADLVLVEVEVTDKDNRRCPLDNSMISFTLDGEAEWRGGMARGKEGIYILEKQIHVECGVNRVLVRSTTKSGKVRLTASAEGLIPASIVFSSVPVQERDGLSTYISGEHQPSNLSRGATPRGASYVVSRRPVRVVAATAGCNEADAVKSFDDNELSEWSNDGRIQSGWIKYELERDAVVNEVELKLTGWRTRSYPVQVFVDDKEVFKGDTPRSLGYVSIPVTPTKGRFVKIQLVGLNSEEDAFGGIVEVTAATTGELDLLKDPNAGNAKGQLRVVEVEVYEEQEAI